MKLIVDLSDYQAGLNIDAVAKAVDGAWAKAGDWSWVRAHGWPADDVHAAVLTRFSQLGRPVGSYFFVRPGWTDPATQIDAWAAHTPAGTTVRPMIDLETPGLLTGRSLTDWVAEALRLATDRFGVTPVLYWSERFASENGMTVPAVFHIPMMAEYHRGYKPFLWGDLATWETYAYSAYGGPGVPAGYGLSPRDVVWQFTSSAQIPGFLGLVDCSFCNETVWSQLTADTPTNEEGWLTVGAKEEILAKLDSLLIPAEFKALGANVSAGRNDVAAEFRAVGQMVQALYSQAGEAGKLVTATKAVVDDIKAMGGSGVAPDPEKFAALVVAKLGERISRTNNADTEPPAELAPPSMESMRANARAASALAALTHEIFDTNEGIAAQTALRMAKMRPAPGDEPTAEEHLEALQGALADKVARATLKATRVDPPMPPEA